MVHFGFFCQVVNYYLTVEIVVGDCGGDGQKREGLSRHLRQPLKQAFDQASS